jgi:hypothetical protein
MGGDEWTVLCRLAAAAVRVARWTFFLALGVWAIVLYCIACVVWAIYAGLKPIQM